MSRDEHRGLRQRIARHVQEDTTARDILLFLVAFRILNALSIRTFFQPDEYFQSLEPAWQIAFGADSGAWTTWVSGPPPFSTWVLTLYVGVEAPPPVDHTALSIRDSI